VPDRQPLRIGCVKYLNARPLIFGGPADVVLDHPSVLCAQLAHAELDVALVSSFEFLRNPIYRIVDGISISSDGPVYSVVVAHVGEISAAEEIELDPAAETSGNLLRCLLSELELRPRFVATSTSSLAKERARLLIGDQAIRFRQQHGNEFQVWDLGENWQNLAGLPFVYALWLVRPEVVDPKFDRGFCDRYYREHLQFSFGKREKEGLRAFHQLCQKHDLLPKRDIAFSVV
jgi:chorismate dehydratase